VHISTGNFSIWTTLWKEVVAHSQRFMSCENGDFPYISFFCRRREKYLGTPVQRRLLIIMWTLAASVLIDYYMEHRRSGFNLP
jgi:hypothetical protein